MLSAKVIIGDNWVKEEKVCPAQLNSNYPKNMKKKEGRRKLKKENTQNKSIPKACFETWHGTKEEKQQIIKNKYCSNQGPINVT